MKTIITHAGRPHMDDTIGVARLIGYYNSSGRKVTILRVRHNDIASFRHIKDAAWVDLGGEYAETRQLFDHHHDPDIRCSMSLVRKYIASDDSMCVGEESNLEKYLDHLDRLGPVSANATKILTKDEIDITEAKTRLLLQILDMWWEKNVPYGTKVTHSTPYHLISNVLTANGNVLDIWVLGEMVNALRAIYPDVHLEAMDKIRADDALLKVDMGNAYDINYKPDTTIKYIGPDVDNNTKFELEDIDADFLIRKSSRDDKVTYLLANTARGRSVNELSHHVDDKNIEFIHNSGFLMVINLPLTKELITKFTIQGGVHD